MRSLKLNVHNRNGKFIPRLYQNKRRNVLDSFFLGGAFATILFKSAEDHFL